MLWSINLGHYMVSQHLHSESKNNTQISDLGSWTKYSVLHWLRNTRRSDLGLRQLVVFRISGAWKMSKHALAQKQETKTTLDRRYFSPLKMHEQTPAGCWKAKQCSCWKEWWKDSNLQTINLYRNWEVKLPYLKKWEKKNSAKSPRFHLKIKEM